MANRIAIDDYDVEGFGRVAGSFGSDSYAYAVTPNVDQLIRYCESATFRSAYAEAAFVLLDSRFLAHCLALLRGQELRVCPGSDLTDWLLQHAVQPRDRIVLVGGSASQAQQLTRHFGLANLVHVDPPMGFIDDPVEVERCLTAVEAASPFRYCFLAVGSPQQELLAQALKARGRARGLALCVGASINFLTGVERRAPPLMRELGMEWLFRLVTHPRRLAHRYLLRGPRIFTLLPGLSFAPRRAVPAPARLPAAGLSSLHGRSQQGVGAV
jgi:exopolysaccharide biosynthesis WecB/TagA/CpsF family protein